MPAFGKHLNGAMTRRSVRKLNGLTGRRGGNYSTGLATAQCMCAPEFAARSAGQRLTVQ